MKFQPAGPPRYRHQKAALRRIIETKGVCALLLPPGLGKTAISLDYASLLALKSPSREARVLVIAPLAAVDTWVLQADTWVTRQVSVWAEAIGGSIKQRCATLASRGGRPYGRVQGNAVRPVGEKRAVHVDDVGLRRSWATYGRAARADGTHERLDSLSKVRERGDKPLLIIESINLDSFASRQAVGSKTMADVVLEAVERFKPDLVIVDEMHKIKGATSNTSRLVGRIGRTVPRRLGLTGTFMPTSPMDVYGQWRFIDPYAFGPPTAKGAPRKEATWTRFQHRYGVMGGFMGRQVVSFQRLDELQEIVGRNSIAFRKEDTLDLPPVTIAQVPVHLSPKEQDAYAQMKSSLALSLRSGALVSATAPNRLTQMMRLRQITSGFVNDDQGVTQVLGTSKLRTIKSIVNDTLEGEDRVVIFAAFRAEIAELEKGLAAPGTTVEVITGDTSSKDRLAIRQRFGDTKRHPGRIVLIAQITTISLSVNELVTASNAVFGSLTLRRDEIIQAQDRLNRPGQTRPMTFWYAVAPGTVDEKILKAHEQRTSLETALLAHILETDEDSPEVRRITRADAA